METALLGKGPQIPTHRLLGTGRKQSHMLTKLTREQKSQNIQTHTKRETIHKNNFLNQKPNNLDQNEEH